MDVQQHIDELRQGLPPDRYVIAFNMDNFRSVKRLFPFAAEAKKQGHALLVLATSIEVDCGPFENVCPVFPMSGSQVSSLRNIDVLITQDQCLFAPLTTRVVSVPHVFRPRSPHNVDPSVYHPLMSFLAGSDYLILNQKNLLRFEGSDFEGILASEPEHCQRQTEVATIIPGGYPPIDVLMEYDRLPEKAVKRSILFAPGMRGASTRESHAMFHDILKMLVTEFRDRDIIYSCFPHAQERVNARHLSRRFSEDNFHFNTSMTNLDMYADSAIAITDTSHTVQTFSFATLRPSIQCVFSGHRKHPVRHGVSWLVHDIDQLRETIHASLDGADEIREEIRRIRDEYIIRPGSTASYVVDNLDVIVRGEALPDWKVVRKRKKFEPWSGHDPLSQLVEKREFKSNWDHRILLDLVSRAHPELDLQQEVSALVSSSTTMTRQNNYNLICLCVAGRTLSLMAPDALPEFLASRTGCPIFLNCGESCSIHDFDIPEQVVRDRFMGHVQNHAGSEATARGAHPVLGMDTVFEKHDDFAVLISLYEYEERFKAVMDMYYASRKAGCALRVDPSTNADMIWLVAYSLGSVPRRLSTVEVMDFYSGSSDQTYMVWGSGGRYRLMRDKGALPREQTMIGFIDNNSAAHGTEVDGRKVHSLQQAIALEPDMVLFAMTHEYVTQVERQLQAMA